MIRAEDGAGLVLMWTCTRGPTHPLQMIFGMTFSMMDMYIRFGQGIMVKIFCNDPNAKICLPSAAKMREYQPAISARHPHLKDAWTTMDGLKIYLQKAWKQ